MVSHVGERLVSNAEEDNSDSSHVLVGAMFIFTVGEMGDVSVGSVDAAKNHSLKIFPDGSSRTQLAGMVSKV